MERPNFAIDAALIGQINSLSTFNSLAIEREEHYENATVKRRKKRPYCRSAFENVSSDDDDDDEVVTPTIVVVQKDETDDVILSCTECSKTFKSQTWLTRHLKIVHQLEKAPEPETGDFFCTECPKRFKSQTWLTRHHNAEHESHYRTTMDVDDDDGDEEEEEPKGVNPKFKCPTCNRPFKTQKWLALHVSRAHRQDDEEEQPAPPAIAAAAAVTATPAVVPYAPVECDVCGQLFTATSHLALHKRVHSGDRPFECDICQRTYKCLKSFNKHLKGEHMLDAQITCVKCRGEFVNEELYTLHWNTQRGKHCKVVGKI